MTLTSSRSVRRHCGHGARRIKWMRVRGSIDRAGAVHLYVCFWGHTPLGDAHSVRSAAPANAAMHIYRYIELAEC